MAELERERPFDNGRKDFRFDDFVQLVAVDQFQAKRTVWRLAGWLARAAFLSHISMALKRHRRNR